MKKIITLFTLVLLLSIATQSNAQWSWGLKSGLNIASFSYATSTGMTIKSVTGYQVGGVVNYYLQNNMFLEAGIGLSTKGSEVSMGDASTMLIDSKIKPQYLEIPINFLYKVDLAEGAYLHLFAGPYLGFGLGGKVSSAVTLSGMSATTSDNSIIYGSDSTANMKSFDFGLNVGVGAELSRFFIRVQYGFGLTNLSPSSDANSSFKNSCIGLSVGYMWGEDSSKKTHRRRRR